MSNHIVITIIVGVFGLIIGSFLNVVILRFNDLKSIINTRSHCPHCQKELRWLDLIPFFSYVMLWGKCRYCKKEISIQYPLVEVGTGLIFTCLYWHYGLSLQFFMLLIISAILIVIFVYDILQMLISDFLVYLALGIWILYVITDYFFIHHSLYFILYTLYGALLLGGFLGLLVLFSWEKWMGIGDIKLGVLVGAVAGWPLVLVSGFAAFIIGSIVGIILIFGSIKSLKEAIPFAPFLITGSFIALFWGNNILNWYLKILGIM